MKWKDLVYIIFPKKLKVEDILKLEESKKSYIGAVYRRAELDTRERMLKNYGKRIIKLREAGASVSAYELWYREEVVKLLVEKGAQIR